MHTQDFPTAPLGRFVMMVIGSVPRIPTDVGLR